MPSVWFHVKSRADQEKRVLKLENLSAQKDKPFLNMKGYLAALDDIDVPVIEEQILRFGTKHPCCTKFDEESFLAKTDLVPERCHNGNAENDTINKCIRSL